MIIESMLDNDLYKFPMQQAVLHQFSDVMVEYKFLIGEFTDQFNCFLKMFGEQQQVIGKIEFL